MIVAGIVAKFGVSGLALVTLMAGAMLILMGVTGLGAAVRFIPRPVTIGFTNGIALLIASTQIKDFLGLRTPAVPSEVVPRLVLLSMVVRMPRRLGLVSSIRSSSIDIKIGASTLLRSWAMPPASVPMLSMRWARRNCCSRFLRSVMSVLIVRIDLGRP